MASFIVAVTALLTTAVSCQTPYGGGGGSGSSGPSVSSCPTQFAISDFTAACERHGTGCSFSFDVATNESLIDAVSCSATFADVAIELPLVPYTYCTGDHSIVWGWAPIGPPNGTATDYSLIITDASLGLAASKIWEATDFPMTTAGATVFQSFTGEDSFDI